MAENITSIENLQLGENVSNNSQSLTSEDYYIYNLTSNEICSLWPNFSREKILKQEQINLLNAESILIENKAATISAIDTDKLTKSVYDMHRVDSLSSIMLHTILGSSYNFFQTTTNLVNINWFDPVFFAEKHFISQKEFNTLKKSLDKITDALSAEDVLSKDIEQRELFDHLELPLSIWSYKKINNISFDLIKDQKKFKHELNYSNYENTDSTSFMSPRHVNQVGLKQDFFSYTQYAFESYLNSNTISVMLASKSFVRRVQDVSDKNFIILWTVLVEPSYIDSITNNIFYQLIPSLYSNLVDFKDIDGFNTAVSNYKNNSDNHNQIIKNLLDEKYIGNNVYDYVYQEELQKIKQEIIQKNMQNIRFLLSISAYYTSPFPLLPIFFLPKIKELKSEYFNVTYPPIKIDYSNNKLKYIDDFIKYRLI